MKVHATFVCVVFFFLKLCIISILVSDWSWGRLLAWDGVWELHGSSGLLA